MLTLPKEKPLQQLGSILSVETRADRVSTTPVLMLVFMLIVNVDAFRNSKHNYSKRHLLKLLVSMD